NDLLIFSWDSCVSRHVPTKNILQIIKENNRMGNSRLVRVGTGCSKDGEPKGDDKSQNDILAQVVINQLMEDMVYVEGTAF
ncbi:MAG: hypothetical protein J1E02_05975, partial [Coprobacter sp.]|nr:hypothetical protein [Coprobacter sp.]